MEQPEIHLKNNFIAQPDVLWTWLNQNVQWDERMRARKTASYGVAYNYSQIAYDDVPLPQVLRAICVQIEEELGFHPNNCLLNYYPDGEASMGFHSDAVPEMQLGTGVAIISVGCQRNIIYRNKSNRDQELVYQLESGSLLYMSEQVQEKWLHAIPKQDNVGPRISLSFRALRGR